MPDSAYDYAPVALNSRLQLLGTIFGNSKFIYDTISWSFPLSSGNSRGSGSAFSELEPDEAGRQIHFSSQNDVTFYWLGLYLAELTGHTEFWAEPHPLWGLEKVKGVGKRYWVDKPCRSVPDDFVDVMADTEIFLEPPVRSLASGGKFHGAWNAKDPWVPTD